jgi:protein gp37
VGDNSGISWTTATWNPTVGCALVSPGCNHCYAAREAAGRLRGVPVYAGLATREPGEPAVFTGEVRCLPERLDQPLRWSRPRDIFVDSMSDLFHPGVPDGFIMRVWQVMGMASWHTFQILTKRPARMASFAQRYADTAGDTLHDDPDTGMPPLPRGPEATRATYGSGRSQLFADMLENMGTPPAGAAYPTYDWMEGMRHWSECLHNVRLGVSIESDPYAWRANHLRVAPAASRFLSLEPLIGPLPSLNLAGIDWVIIGGESGPGARPMDLGWARELIARCREAGVAPYVKQLGACWSGRGHRDLKGGDIETFPADLQVRETP